MRIRAWAIAAGVSSLGFAAPASAVQILASSYSLPNGDGQAGGGVFNYWDKNYTGTGSTTTDGAALSSGMGDLTNGIISLSPWFTVENSAGTGPYVGWHATETLNPVLTFHFSGLPSIDSIAIALDNSGQGRVFAPAAILVDGAPVAFTAPASGTADVVILDQLGLTGSTHTIEFDQVEGGWVFVSEIQFFSTLPNLPLIVLGVPEPTDWAMLISGFGLIGAAMRLSRRRSAPAA